MSSNATRRAHAKMLRSISVALASTIIVGCGDDPTQPAAHLENPTQSAPSMGWQVTTPVRAEEATLRQVSAAGSPLPVCSGVGIDPLGVPAPEVKPLVSRVLDAGPGDATLIESGSSRVNCCGPREGAPSGVRRESERRPLVIADRTAGPHRRPLSRISNWSW